jgi:predicted TIM-barrel fold metal-dependent hydrolase
MEINTRRSFLLAASAALVGASRVPGRPKTQLHEVLEQAPLANTHEHTMREDERIPLPFDLFVLYQGYSTRDLQSAGLRAKVFDTTRPVLERWREFEPHWKRARNTGYVRAIDLAVRNLYGAETLSEQNVEEVSARVTGSNKKGVNDFVLRQKCRTPLVVLDDKYPNPVQPESSLFRTARRFDKFILATTRDALKALEEETGRSVATFRDMESALEHDFVKNVQFGPMVTVKTTIAYQRPLSFRKVTREAAERDFEQIAKNQIAPPSRDPFLLLTEPRARDLQDYLFHRIVQLAHEHRMPMQIHTGIQAGQNYIANSNPMQLTNLFFQYPDQVFDLFHSGYPYMREALALAKMFTHVYIDMCWTHIISPSGARHMLHEYLDTIPSNKVFGFGGDNRWAEQSYGHSLIARENIIRVLDERVAGGDLEERQAIEIGRRLLHDNAAEIFTRHKA